MRRVVVWESNGLLGTPLRCSISRWHCQSQAIRSCCFICFVDADGKLRRRPPGPKSVAFLSKFPSQHFHVTSQPSWIEKPLQAWWVGNTWKSHQFRKSLPIWSVKRSSSLVNLTYISTSTFQQVSEKEAFVDLKVAGGDLLEGPGRVIQ